MLNNKNIYHLALKTLYIILTTLTHASQNKLKHHYNLIIKTQTLI